MNRKVKALCTVAVLACFSSAMVSMASAAQFTSAGGKYPVTITATSTADVFDKFGSSEKCTNNTFSGTLAAASESLTLTPTWSSCTSFGLPSTFTSEAGTWEVTSDGTVHIKKKFTEHVYSSTPHVTTLCTNETFPQTPAGKVTWTNNANGTVTMSGTISGITSTQERNSIFCPAGTHTTTASYTIQSGGIVFSGKVGGVAEAIHVK